MYTQLLVLEAEDGEPSQEEGLHDLGEGLDSVVFGLSATSNDSSISDTIPFMTTAQTDLLDTALQGDTKETGMIYLSTRLAPEIGRLATGQEPLGQPSVHGELHPYRVSIQNYTEVLMADADVQIRIEPLLKKQLQLVPEHEPFIRDLFDESLYNTIDALYQPLDLSSRPLIGTPTAPVIAEEASVTFFPQDIPHGTQVLDINAPIGSSFVSTIVFSQYDGGEMKYELQRQFTTPFYESTYSQSAWANIRGFLLSKVALLDESLCNCLAHFIDDYWARKIPESAFLFACSCLLFPHLDLLYFVQQLVPNWKITQYIVRDLGLPEFYPVPDTSVALTQLYQHIERYYADESRIENPNVRRQTLDAYNKYFCQNREQFIREYCRNGSLVDTRLRGAFDGQGIGRAVGRVATGLEQYRYYYKQGSSQKIVDGVGIVLVEFVVTDDAKTETTIRAPYNLFISFVENRFEPDCVEMHSLIEGQIKQARHYEDEHVSSRTTTLSGRQRISLGDGKGHGATRKSLLPITGPDDEESNCSCEVDETESYICQCLAQATRIWRRKCTTTIQDQLREHYIDLSSEEFQELYYKQRDRAIVLAACSGYQTLLDVDCIQDVFMLYFPYFSRDSVPIPAFNFMDYTNLALYNNRLYALRASRLLYLTLLRYRFTLTDQKDTDRQPLVFSEAFDDSSLQALLRQIFEMDGFAVLQTLLTDLRRTCTDSYGDIWTLPDSESIAPESYCNVLALGDFQKLTTLKHTDVTAMLRPFLNGRVLTNEERIKYALNVLALIEYVYNASIQVQNTVRRYVIESTYMSLREAPKNPEGMAKYMAESVVAQMKDGYCARLTNVFVPLSPMLLNSNMGLSCTAGAFLHTNLRSPSCIEWLVQSNSFRPHTFDELDVVSRESALLYVQKHSHIRDDDLYQLLLQGSAKQQCDGWPFYGVSYRKAIDILSVVEPVVVWDRDNIPSDYSSMQRLADSVFNRGKYIITSYGSNKYGNPFPIDSGDIPAADYTPEDLEAFHTLIQRYPNQPYLPSALQALFGDSERPVSMRIYFTNNTGQEASLHNLEEEQVSFGVLRLRIHQLMRILLEWIAIYAVELLPYFDRAGTITFGEEDPEFQMAELIEDESDPEEGPTAKLTAPTVPLAHYFKEKLNPMDSFSIEFEQAHQLLIQRYYDTSRAARVDKVLEALELPENVDDFLRYYFFPTLSFPVPTSQSEQAEKNSLPPPPRLPGHLQFFLTQVYTGPDPLLYFFMDPIIAVPVVARSLQRLLGRVLHAEQRASYVWRTLGPDSHYRIHDPASVTIAAFDRKLVQPRVLGLDMRRRVADLEKGHNPELWPFTPDPSCIHLALITCPHVMYPTPTSDPVLLESRYVHPYASANIHNPRSTLAALHTPHINPGLIRPEIVQDSYLRLPRRVTPACVTSELIRIASISEIALDKTLARTVMYASEKLFGYITTGLPQRQNAAQAAGAQEGWFLDTPEYRALAEEATSYVPSDYLLPPRPCITDIYQELNSPRNTAEYDYTEAEKSIIESVLAPYQCERPTIIQEFNRFYEQKLPICDPSLIPMITADNIGTHWRHLLLPCISLRSFNALLSILKVQGVAPSMGSLQGVRSVLLNHIVAPLILNHENGDFHHPSIRNDLSIIRLICHDIYVILRYVVLICLRIEYALQLIERVPPRCRQVAVYGIRSIWPFPFSRYNAGCVGATLFGYDNLETFTACSKRIFYSTSQYFQSTDETNLANCRCHNQKCPYCGGIGQGLGMVCGSPVEQIPYVELKANYSNGILDRAFGPEETQDGYPIQQILFQSGSLAYNTYGTIESLLYKQPPAIPFVRNDLMYKEPVEDPKPARGGSRSRRSMKDGMDSNRILSLEEINGRLRSLGKPLRPLDTGYPVACFGERLVDTTIHLPPLDSRTFAEFLKIPFSESPFVKEYTLGALGHDTCCISTAAWRYLPQSSELYVHLNVASSLDDSFLYLCDSEAFRDYKYVPPSALSPEELAENGYLRYTRANQHPLEQHIFPSHVAYQPSVISYPEAAVEQHTNILLELLKVTGGSDTFSEDDFQSNIYTTLGMYSYPLLTLEKHIQVLTRRVDNLCTRILQSNPQPAQLHVSRPGRGPITSPRTAVLFLLAASVMGMPVPAGNVMPLCVTDTIVDLDDPVYLVENHRGVVRFSQLQAP
ncbi:hypothetical protein GMRT_14469 [Giardia muris]|uniref:Uncharacterized protein n=1 Tax=Giardia muris TaxID=5742 RepID=A0A4Z1T2U0_GIAMU|nr:hypothetical protein GMRT_14469 [Giardia muris]|eukprot:TNJ28263.1 hypothetical protein GMRT_14469 [Giardia muris]